MWRCKVSGNPPGNHNTQSVHPGRTERTGNSANTIRLSIGIEKAEDLIAALESAFDAVSY